MVTLTPEQVADLKRKIEAKYEIAEVRTQFSSEIGWCVLGPDCQPINDNDYDDPLDAEAEMEAIIQDEVKAAMQEME